MAKSAKDQLWVVRLGVVPYRDALAFQEAVRVKRQDGELPDTLLLLEHPPVYTRGRRSREGELGFAPEWYEQQGIDVVTVPRGGLLTYHGPGQLVGYPVVRVREVAAYVHQLEDALVAALADEGIEAHSRPEDGPAYMGVWVGEDRKLASVGVHVAHHVATHGFAVNVDNDMRPWEWVVACGLPGVRMTSIADERGETALTRPPASEPFALAREPSDAVRSFSDRIVARFAEAFGKHAVEMPVAALDVQLPEPDPQPDPV
ncbi:lipoyl(octanoyl) transferase LipB [Conexibacter woesei]|uniref:Octanoyltransferase n=1 Tax=Conexibacter woesei (strain DSM 14684 / CCUG 47730 / CIP 108061 / JCM 11494 / NBRC 100937 / ID131577) TaxID=469383 RepID=D3FAA8_CONWI|nr:lipoyl(octanoyl) transferase LipB [Conexibacter woesei]ADB49177.1 lipoate-protein ligase B [Conexibacter woesei DSM 14684]